MKGIIKSNHQETEITTPITDSNKISIFNYVNKSNLMLASIKEPLSVNSYKLLDLYLSMLEESKSEDGALVIRKKDFENMLGVERIRTEYLNKWCDELFNLKIAVGINPDKNSELPVHMFSYFGVIVDEDSGQTVIAAKYNQDAKNMFFDNGAINSIKYQLKVTVNLKSELSIRLYIYLRSNLFFYSNGDFRRKWEIPFDKLRKEMCCGKAYKDNFKEFNRRIFSKAQAEINEKTDLAFEYKYNRVTQSISFEIKRFDKTIFVKESGCSTEPEVEISEEEAKKLQLQAKVETQIDFESLVADGYSEKYLNLIVKTICEVKSKASNSKSKISGVSIPTKEVTDKFDSLAKEHIAYVLDTLEVARKTTKIANIKSYLKTMLFNADEAFVTNESCKTAQSSSSSSGKKSSNASYSIDDLKKLDYIDSI